MENPMRIIVNDTGEIGYVIIGRMTYTEGEHEIWNDEVKDWPDFQELVRSGRVEILPD
jgi:hypothetical protein